MANNGNASLDHRSLLKGIESLFKSRDYSDLSIKCGSRAWPVHESIVCIQSTFFAATCKREWQDPKHAITELHDEVEEVVEQLIEFLYKSTYDDAACNASHIPLGPLQFGVKMYTAADKYDIPTLAPLVIAKFDARLAQPANKEDFSSAVHELYREAPESASKMRNSIVAAALNNASLLFGTEVNALITCEEFQHLIGEVPVFGMEVLVALSDKIKTESEHMNELKELFENGVTWNCISCKTVFHVIQTQNDYLRHSTLCPSCTRVVHTKKLFGEPPSR